MLDVAIKYADALKDKMYDTWFNEKYKYWNFSTYYSDIDIKDETWAEDRRTIRLQLSSDIRINCRRILS